MFGCFDSEAKIFLILYLPFENSTTHIAIMGTVRNHVKLIHVVNSRRGFSKGTVLCGGY